MARRKPPGSRGDILQGTLDMLILRTLLFGPAHGHTIAHAIEKGSSEVLQVEHGSLYPALHRLVRRGVQMGALHARRRGNHGSRGRRESAMSFWQRRDESLNEEIQDYLERQA